MVTQQTPRPRRASTGLVRRLAFSCMVSGAAWLSRASIALVFMLGMLATASATRVVVERDLVVERSEDTEATGQAGFHHVQAPRRVRTGAAPLAYRIASPSAPRVLEPRPRAAPRPSWQRPRRTDPPDEDDESPC